jgi:hypothetical protein
VLSEKRFMIWPDLRPDTNTVGVSSVSGDDVGELRDREIPESNRTALPLKVAVPMLLQA